MVIENIVVGTTEEYVETLKTDFDDGFGLVPQNLSGKTVEFVLRDCNNTLITLQSAQYGIKVASAGTAFYKPAANDFNPDLAPYTSRWKVTDGSGDVAYWPSLADSPVKWLVGV